MTPAPPSDPHAPGSEPPAPGARDVSLLLTEAADAPPPPAGPLSRLRDAVRDLADTGAALFETVGAGRAARQRWILRQRGPDFDVLRVRRGRAEAVGVVRGGQEGENASWRPELARAGAVELRLDPDHLLRRTLTLPAESRDFLKAIVEHRLDRLTPWTADNVVFGYRVAAGRPGAKDISVDFAATSRTIAAEALARVAALGLLPTAMGSAADPAERPVEIDLLSGRGDRSRLRRRRRLRHALLALAALSLAAYLASAYAASQAHSRLASVSAELDAQRSVVLALSSGSAAGDAASALMGAKTLEGATFHIIDTLADVIPDGTFLTDLEIRPTSLRLKGRSLDAPALVPLLESRAGLRDVRFEAPVIRETGGGDRFAIVATPSSAAAAEAGSGQP